MYRTCFRTPESGACAERSTHLRIRFVTAPDDDLDDIPPLGVQIATRRGTHESIVKSGRWKEAVQAYLAAGSFADAMVGRLLDALDRSPYADNTIIAFWGDHGWHLGEKHHWHKGTLWEEAARAPLIVVAPGVTKPNTQCHRTVDFMSIYPTLAELCGLPIPQHVEGTSLRMLLVDPNAPWDRPAITTRRAGDHTVRTERFRYIRYSDGSEELYDHEKDPMEWTNLAMQSDYAKDKNRLAQWLSKKDGVHLRP